MPATAFPCNKTPHPRHLTLHLAKEHHHVEIDRRQDYDVDLRLLTTEERAYINA